MQCRLCFFLSFFLSLFLSVSLCFVYLFLFFFIFGVLYGLDRVSVSESIGLQVLDTLIDNQRERF